MDEAGLTTTDIMSGKRSIAKIVNGIRTSMALQLKEYIEKIENAD